MNNMNTELILAIERDYRHLRSISKSDVIARYPSRLSKDHLRSESKGGLINDILIARYGAKAVSVWANK